jgi:deazaflavin-dependent oxidoreductase (nitroreductase family)
LVSVKVPPSGSRGLRLPRFLASLGNRFMLWQFGRGGARTRGGVSTLMLETVGAKSGKRRRSVLGYLAEGDDAWLVIAALAGAPRHPAWLHNLASQPDAMIQFDEGRRVDVRVETLEGDDLKAAWERIATDASEFVGYRSKTDREIPVVRLRKR